MPASPNDSSAESQEPSREDFPRGSQAPLGTGKHLAGEHRVSLWKSFQRYLASLIEISRWRLLAAVMMMVLTSLTEGLGVVLLFPILQVAGFNLANQGHVGHYTAEVQQFLRGSGLRPSLWLATLLMIFMLLMALRSLFSRTQSVLTSSTVLKYEMTLSRRLYGAVINAEWLFLVRRRSSDFTHALTAELARVSTCTLLLIGTLSNATLALLYIGVAFKLSVETTLMVLGAGAALLLVSGGWMRIAHESGTALSDSVGEVYSAATEHLQNLKAMKTYDAQNADLKMFTSLEASVLEQSLRNTRNQAAAAFWFEAGSLVVLGAVIFVSLQILRVGPASILLLLVVFTRLMPRLALGNSQLQAFLTDLPAFENVTRILEECREHAEEVDKYAPGPALAQELRLERVSFRYEPALPLVLDRVSLTIAAGSITAIGGSSGAGKTTLADLINGLLLPDSGCIFVDDVELTPQLARAWRRQVGYVAQDTVLFHDTVRANLLWAQPAASEEELREALKLAAAEFVFDLPASLETLVGDRGSLLSHGQRQRIALARALLRKPALLILDEATNSLDLGNEKRILDAIAQLKGRTTVLMIAHRASALERAETIYVVENGAVIEAGDWKTFSSQPANRAELLSRLQDARA
jgi:ATP-binding cassette, subfamily C, bacterial